MATQRLLDVWILEGNTVYRGVPFQVVADWLQQGRLLPEDRVSLAGGKKWLPLMEVGPFQPYLPAPDPMAAEDTAEALEPVEMGLGWGKLRDEEDDDVDMIPLIDISLVLLIFFMMTATVSTAVVSPIQTPQAKHQLHAISKDMLWVGMERDPKENTLLYSLGDEAKTFVSPDQDKDKLLRGLTVQMDAKEGPVHLRIRADQDLALKVVQTLTADLQALEKTVNAERGGRRPGVAFIIYAEVREPKN